MKKLMLRYILNPITLLILSGVLLSVAFADPTMDAPADSSASAPSASAPTTPALPGDKAKEVPPKSEEAPPPANLDELMAELKALRGDYAAYKSAESGGKKAALFGLISAVALFLMRMTKVPLVKKYGKSVVPKVGLALGVAVGLFAALAAGQPVLDSVLYGAGPPLATFLHELLKKQPKPTEA